jgi:hypothetical protein
LNNELPSTTESNRDERAQIALNSAIAYTLGGLRTNAEGDSSDWGERSGQEWRLLKSFCASEGLAVPGDIALEPGGSEHDAFLDPVSRRWFKFTKPGRCGWHVDIDEDSCTMLPATPLQYLARWRISNHLFHDDAGLVGIARTEAGNRIVISQRHIFGEGPSWDEIDEYFVDQRKFKRIDPPKLDSCGGYHSRAYWFGRYAVFDVRPPNCILDKSGSVVPIDVIPVVCPSVGASYLSRFVVS